MIALHPRPDRTWHLQPVVAVALILAACAALLGLPVRQARAQRNMPQPNLLALFPPGGQAGTTVEVQITAQSELEGADRLHFSHPGIVAKQKMHPVDKFYPEPRPIEDTFRVTVAKDVPPGVYEVRAAGPFGASNARRFVVEEQPLLVEEENNSLETEMQLPLEGVVYGRAEQGRYDYYRIEAKRGEQLLIDCSAERIDSGADLSLSILLPDGEEIARSQDVLGRDPLIAFNPPQDGPYLVRVHELTYGTDPNSANAPYRLSVSRSPRIDFVDPPVAQRGQRGRFTLYGWNLGEGSQPVEMAGEHMEKLAVSIDVPAQADVNTAAIVRPNSYSLDLFTWRHSNAHGRSNAVHLALADRALLTEQEPNDHPDAAQPLELPAEVIGRFQRPGDFDWYTFDAKKDEQFWIEVASQRLGLITDPLVVVQQVTETDDGEISVRDVATQDDQPSPETRILARMASSDPAWVFTAAAAGRYRVMVRDQFGSSQGGPRQFYHLRIVRPEPDFRLVAFPGIQDPTNTRQQPGPLSCVVRRGSAEEVLVVALRREGFAGPIELRIEGLPKQVSAAPVTLGPQQAFTSLILRAHKDAPRGAAAAKIVGTADIGGKPIEHQAACAEMLWNMNNQPVSPLRLQQELVVSVDETTLLPGYYETAEQKPLWRMARGGKLEIPVRFVKLLDEVKGNIELHAIGLPADNSIRASRTNISAAKPEGTLTLDINTNAPAGKWTITARGYNDFEHRRNIDLAEQAEEDAKRLDKLAKELSDAYRQSTQARQQAEREAQSAATAKSNAENVRRAAEQKLGQAAQQAKQSADRAAEAKKQADLADKRATELAAKVAAAGDDAARQAAQNAAKQAQQQADQAQAAYEAAKKQAEEYKRREQEAQDELAAAETAISEAEKALTLANEAKEQATAEEQQAKADSDRATQLKREADDRQRRYQSIARPQNTRAVIHSDPIAVEIVPYPARVTLPEKVQVRAGEEVTFQVSAQREFEFEDEIEFSLQSPSGVGGLGLSRESKIEKSKDGGQITITTNKNTKPGTYTTEMRVRMRFNNRNLEESRHFEFAILPPAEEEKK